MLKNVKLTTIVIGLLVFLMALITGLLAGARYHSPIANFVTPQQEEEVLEIEESDDFFFKTVEEYINFKNELKECKRVDSVFVNMPDSCLMRILETHGTSLSYYDLVYIYETYYKDPKESICHSYIEKSNARADTLLKDSLSHAY